MSFVVPSFCGFGKDYGKIGLGMPLSSKSTPDSEEKVRIHLSYYVGLPEVFPDKKVLEDNHNLIARLKDQNSKLDPLVLRANYESNHHSRGIRLAIHALGTEWTLKRFLDNITNTKGLPHAIEIPWYIHWWSFRTTPESVSAPVYHYLKEKVKERKERFVECKDGFARTGNYAPWI